MKQITLDSLLEINDQKITIKAWLRSYAKQKGFGVFQTSKGPISANDFAKLLFDYAVSGDDLDDSLVDYSECVAEISATIEDFLVGNEKKDKKPKLEVVKTPTKIELFGESLGKGADSTVEVSKSFIRGIESSFPKTILVNDGGSISVSKEATTEDIGIAFGAAVQLEKTTKLTGNILGFIIGELTNAAVAAGVYPTKKDCATDISRRLEDANLKSLSVKSIENLARTAERIPAEKRDPEVPITVYHNIANVKQPKQMEGESNANFTKRKKKYDENINQILDKVMDGAITDVKEVKSVIDGLQKSSGLKEDNSYSMGDYMKIFMEASMLLTMVGKDGTLALDVDGNTVTLTRDELQYVAKSALSHYTNMKISDPKADIVVSPLLTGYMSENGKQ
jgi:hypothetical protein